ncbi:GEVED domain-containing protein [Flavobacterium ustbae]|uniref:GEVED domain-containing protein n=1 Tax=Flavobacterium ustbae TaxID=2488790 RepID=UPI000F7758F9|nr:GEVED domain-containing protein [Flavobacterium ustbae]
MMRKLLYSFLFFISSKSLSKKSCTPSLGLLCVGMFFVVSFVNAQTTYYSIRNGNWNANSTWSTTPTGGAAPSIPGTNDTVIIRNGHTVTVTANQGITQVTISSGGRLTLNAFTLSISRDFTNNGTLTANSSSTVTLEGTASSSIVGSSTSTFGNLTINKSTAAATVTNSSVAFTTTGNLTVTRGNLVLLATDNHYTVSGNLTVSTNGILTHSVDWDGTSRQLNVGGNLSLDGNGAYSKGTAGRSHVSMYGTTATVRSGLSSFNILTFSTSGTITANGTLKVDNNFWTPFNTGGTFNTGGNSITALASMLVSNGTVNVAGGSLNVEGQLQVGQAGGAYGTVNINGGTIITDGIILGSVDGAATSTITHTGGTMQVNGPVTINQPVANGIANTWNINDAAVNVSGLITFATPAVPSTNNTRVQGIVITTGTLNADGGITFANVNNTGRRIVMSGGAGNLNLKGALTLGGQQTLSAGTTSAFSYVDTAVSQTVNYFTSGGYNNLYINNTSSAGATLSNPITASNVTGNLLVGNTNTSSVFRNGGHAIALANNRNFNVANGSTFNLTGTSSMVTVSGTGTKTFGSTSTVNYGGTIQTVSVEGYGHLSFNGSGTKTLSGATTALGNITIGASSTLDVSSSNFAVNVGGNFTSSGTFTPRSGTVTLNGTNQSFNIPNFNNLTLSGSGTKSFAATTAVSNALVINSTVNANLGNGQTHTANTLTLGATEVLPTTWGNTISPSVSKNDTYFTATTGIVRVANSACTNFSSVAPITSVSLNNVTRTSSGTGTYEDLTSTVLTTVVKGQSYALTVTGNTVTDQNVYYSAFFDWNNDGTFAYPSEYLQIGPIRNSSGSGSDGKSASIYVTIPTGTNAFTGTVKMRIIGRAGDYNNAPCAVTGSGGQMEDYTITIQDVCSGNFNPGQTFSSTGSVCPNTPFTLSLQNIIQDGASYTWQTSPNGTDSWANAVPAPSSFFGPEAFNTSNSEANVYGAAVIEGGQLVLTPAINSQYGAYVIQKTPGSNIDAFSVNFDYQITNGGGADGFSLSYADDVQNNDGGGESGSGSRLIVEFDTYDNEGVITPGSRIRIKYGGKTIYNSNTNSPILRPTSGDTPVLLRVDAYGKLTLTVNNNVVVSGLSLPSGYLSSNKSLWRFKFAGRTGGINDRQIIDNLSIRYLDITGSGPTFVTSQTVPTYYRVAVSCNSSAPNYSLPVLVGVTSAIINPMTTNICNDVAFTATPTDVTNGTIPANTTYTWTAPLVTGGMTGGAANTVAASNITGTLTNSTATAQTATYTVTPITGGCNGVPFTLTVTVNPSPTTPSTSHTNVSCGNLGSITLTDLPSADWTVEQTGQMGIHLYNRLTNETTLTIENLEVGEYHFIVTNKDTSCFSSQVTVDVTDLRSITEWDGSGWTNGNPDGNKTVIVTSVSPNQPFTNNTPTVPVNLTVCSLEIAVSGPDPVEIPSNMTLTVTNGITSDGNLVFESGSSLLQDESAVNSGNVSYKRKVDLSRFDVVYWGTPLVKADFKMRDFSPYTLRDKFHYWDNVNSTWILSDFGEETMKVGEGYSIRAPQYFDLTAKSTFEGVFVGVPYNGDKTVQVVPNKLNLIGNPYPSAVDARKLIEENEDHIGALYFWTHALPPQQIPGTTIFRYQSADFVVFTLAGSTRVTGEAVIGTEEFDGFIATGQAFFTRTPVTASEIKFNNGQRTGSSENTQFYKTAETDKTEKNRLWLNVTNSKGAFKQLLIGYMDGATNGIDLAYDATSMNANANVDFYTINEGKKLTIQGRALPFDNTEIIPLGFKCGIDDSADRDFTFSLDHADGFFDTQEVYLEDKILGKVIDLRRENYTFTSAKGTYSTRFVLRYTNKTLGTGDFENLENSVLVSVKDKAVKITSSKETLKEVNIYNVGAQLLYSNDKVNASELQITNLHSSDQVILVQITLENGHTFTKKVIFSNL